MINTESDNEYLKKMEEYTLFVSKKLVDDIRDGEKVFVHNRPVYVEFVKRIVQDPEFFKYTSKFFNDETHTFMVTYKINGDTGAMISYKKSFIVGALNELVSSGELELNEVEKERYNYLKDKISFEKFAKKKEYDSFEITMDGKPYSISIRDMISFLNKSDDEFHDICKNDDIQTIYGIPKKEFIFGTIRYFKDNSIFSLYDVPINMYNHFSEILELQLIDVQAINMYQKTEDTIYKKVDINDELRSAILDDMPDDLSTIEKAIYIYIKMCKTLTYDEEYFAGNQRGSSAKKHADIEHISTITPDNNIVVCFEFNAIYSKFLSELGINFASKYKNMMGETYGHSHADLTFRYDKFLVSADSVTSIVKGDIFQAKLNQPLNGLKCINVNENTKAEFNEMVTKVYNIIAEQDKTNENDKVEHVQSLEELLEEYSYTTNNLKKVSMHDKLFIMIDKVRKRDMASMDSHGYVLQLRNILFTEDQRDNNFKITILRNNDPDNKELAYGATAVISLNSVGFYNDMDKTLYFYFNPNKRLVSISRDDLQEKFNNGIYALITSEDPKIPGINEGGLFI